MAVEFVVVLGVLLALAADSGLERRRLRQEARAALEALRVDIQRDVTQIETHWEPELKLQEAARARLSSFLRGTHAITDSVRFTGDVRQVASYMTLDPNTAAIDELKSTGGLSLIRDQGLKAGILSYGNEVENIAEFDVLHRALFLELYADLATEIVRGLALPASFRADITGADADSRQEARVTAALALNGQAIRSLGHLERLLAATGQPFAIKAGRYRALHADGVLLLGALDTILGGS